MMDSGYYRAPTIAGETIVFVSEEDLWTVAADGGIARRLTSGLGAATNPALSPDGRLLAFSGREEGPPEVYTMSADGGQPRRITFVGAGAAVVGWTPEGKIAFVSSAGQPFWRLQRAFEIGPDGGEARILPIGPADFVSFGPGGGCVLSRPAVDAAFWKRYRGGTAGDLWIRPDPQSLWRRLIRLEGNPSRPLWVGQRIYFISDHEGIGNIYSCTAGGDDLRRHTDHRDFYARGASSDGRRIVYHCGGDLFVFNPADGTSRLVPVDYRSPRTQRNRRFVDPGRYMEAVAPHPQGHLLALTSRGRIAAMGNWDGAVQQIGEPCAGRYRLALWLNDGKRLVSICDAEGIETLVIHRTEELAAPQSMPQLDIGRVVAMKVSPKADQVALANMRNELILVDLAAQTMRRVDRSEHAPIWGFDFSPDGKWLAYSWSASMHVSIIKLNRLEDGATFAATRPVLADIGPAFDPDGKYLYFLSRREFDPVYDQMHFDLGFPKGMRPYLITLRKDLPSPFVLTPKPPEEPRKPEEKKDAAPDAAKPEEATPAEPLVIDLDGIEDRIAAFPVPEGIYLQIDGVKGKALFTSVPVEGALKTSFFPGGEPPGRATLEMFDFETGRTETIVREITGFALGGDRKWLVYRAGNRLRVIKSGEKSDDAAIREGPGRKSGWVDLSRIRLSVEPPAEWRQMYGEAWRLQRDHFWTADMAEVDWDEVYGRYRPLLDRVSTRGEFADVLGEMQGELGSSHAYVLGGDYRPEPRYDVGFLGADLRWDDAAKGWAIAHIVRGDAWNGQDGCPLLRPGVNAKEGEVILAVNGRRVSADLSPLQLLVNQAAVEASLTLADPQGYNPRTVLVRTARNEMPARYREWVEKNRAFVHEQTAGRCGYVHIPDMGPHGYAEFHRSFLLEVDREGLVIDVRFNGGGHVSALLLEKLARRRLAYVQTRWFGIQPWPEDSPAGPMVAITNEYAGSDGDIFSHNFKAMKLGPLLGKRTWGGVIGIWPRHTLVDGGLTTQPEFSFWFRDIGWKVENYGVDPDIEIEMRPEDYAVGSDPQLVRAIDELKKLLPTASQKVELSPRPSRAWRK